MGCNADTFMPLFPADTLGSLVTNTFFLVTRGGADFEGIFDNQQDVFSWWGYWRDTQGILKLSDFM